MTSRGADIPTELVNKAVYALFDEDAYAFAFGGLERHEKHARGLVSLTCRYFSEILRPTIFKVIRLESRNRLLTLILFLDSSTSQIKDYIEIIEVAQYEPCEPWLHLLHTSLMYRLPYARIKYFSLVTQESSPSTVTLRSIHRGPPTSILPACWHIERLNLTNFRLYSFDHLVKLVAGLPHLSRLRCERLVWPNVLPDSLPALRRYNRGKEPWSLSVQMNNCAEHWPIFWSHPGISQIERGDVRIMGRLVRYTEYRPVNRERTENVGTLVKMNSSNVKFDDIGSFLEIRLPVKFDGPFNLYPRAPVHLEFTFTEEQPRSVVKLKLTVSRHSRFRSVNWQEFDEQASGLRNLERAEIYLSDRRMLDSVAVIIIPRLTLLRNANKLRATYQKWDDSELDLDINDLEGSLAALGGIKEEDPGYL